MGRRHLLILVLVIGFTPVSKAQPRPHPPAWEPLTKYTEEEIYHIYISAENHTYGFGRLEPGDLSAKETGKDKRRLRRTMRNLLSHYESSSLSGWTCGTDLLRLLGYVYPEPLAVHILRYPTSSVTDSGVAILSRRD